MRGKIIDFKFESDSAIHRSTQPVSCRFGKELSECDALPANQQLALGLELPGKGFHTGERFAAAAAFDFNRNRILALLQDKIHFMISFTPV